MRLLPDHALLQVAFLERLGAIPERLVLATPQRLVVGGDRAAGHHFVVTVATVVMVTVVNVVVTVAVTAATTTGIIAALDAGGWIL